MDNWFENDIQRILDSAPEGAYAEIYRESLRELPLILQNGHVRDLCWRSSKGAGLRYIKNDVSGFSSCSAGAESSDLIEAAKASLKARQNASGKKTRCSDNSSEKGNSAERVNKSKDIKAEVLKKAKSHNTFSSSDTKKLTPSEMVDTAYKIYHSLQSFESAMDYTVRISKNTHQVRIADSYGMNLERESTAFSLAMSAVEGDDFGGLYEGWVSSEPLVNTDGAVQRLKEWISARNTNDKAPSGKVPVIFTSKALRFFMYAISIAIDGDAVNRGISPLGHALGEKIGNGCFTLKDRPRLKHGIRSRAFDDEGTETRDITIINRGRLKTFLYDGESARKADCEPTGHAKRTGYAAPPKPGCSNLTVVPGKYNMDALMQIAGDGLLIDQLVGATSGNIRTGEFACAVHNGYRIRDGRRCGRVRGAMISGNVFSLLKQIQAVGSEVMPGWHGYCPPLLINGINCNPG